MTSKLNYLHKAAITGNIVETEKCIINGISVYSPTESLETALHFALMGQHIEIANILWAIYENDLKFVHESIKCCKTLSITNPIVIGCGTLNNSKIEQLYIEYANCEISGDIYQTNCVVVLLKTDNFTPNRVLCLSPKTKYGQMLTVQMINCLFSNGFLDLNQVSRSGISLAHAAASAGVTTIFNTLLDYGVQSKSIEIALHAIQYGQVEFLDQFYQRFPTDMYEFFQNYCFKILHSNIWEVVKYFAKKIIAEKQMTWKQFINFRVPSTSTTLFSFAIQNNLMEIAENLLNYDLNFNAEDKHGRTPFYYLQWSTNNFDKYHNFITKVIEMDPEQLGVRDEEMSTILHKLIISISADELIQIYEEFPKAKHIFFKVQSIALKCIETMILRKHFDTIKFLIDSSREYIDYDLMYSILNKLVMSDNVELFRYVMSMENFDFSALESIQSTNPMLEALKYRNLEAFNLMLVKVNKDRLKTITDTKYGSAYNLLFYCIIYSSPVFNNNLSWVPEYTDIMKNINEEVPSSEFNDIFDLLIRNSVSYKEKCMTYNLLHVSVMANNLHAVNKLLQLKIRIDESDASPDKRLPIHFAQNVEMFELLNSAMQTLYVMDPTLKNGVILLHRIVSGEPTDTAITLVEYILENEGDINETDQFGESAIFHARNVDMAKVLLKYEPYLNLINRHNQTAIDHAFAERRYDLGYFLLEQSSVRQSIKMNDLPLLNPFFEDTISNFNSILANSMFRAYLQENCNKPYKLGIPLIFDAIRHNDELTNVLLEFSNLDLSVIDSYTQNTPLHAATRYGKIDVVDRLIERGLQIEVRNIHGDTPLNLYCRHSADICLDHIIMILKYDPDVNVKNDREMSPILYASTRDTMGDVICELLNRGANIMDRKTGPTGPTAYENMAGQLQRLFQFLLYSC